MTIESLATGAYLVAALLFIMSLAGLSRHESGKQGIWYGIVGMGIALIATVALAVEGGHHGRMTTIGIALMIIAVILGAAVGLWRARVVEMTGMLDNLSDQDLED
ncbi:MAG: NAD(P)(+) transhydrogenase (Re/Si-specific) subunit beta, partial [Candidatus Nanopelagicales bacterium]